MAVKQIAVRIDAATAEQSVNEILGDAVREYSESHPVSREHMLEIARAIAEDDASLLKALADA
jgi:hypothetical protein